MKQTRKKYDAKLKAKVAIEALKERETLNELAAKYELSSVMISQRKKAQTCSLESRDLLTTTTVVTKESTVQYQASSTFVRQLGLN